MRPRHCARRSLESRQAVDLKTLPTPGQILASMSDNKVGGEKYDQRMAGARAADDVVMR